MSNSAEYSENSIIDSTTGFSSRKPHLVPKGRGNDSINDKVVGDGGCLCFRKKTGCVLCRACGHLMPGRKQLRCLTHPRIVFLMDLTACVKCKAYAFMLMEVDAQKDYQCSAVKGTRLKFGASNKIAANFTNLDLNNNN